MADTPCTLHPIQCQKQKAPMIICIDGPSGVGKSTLARRLATELAIAYLDTGAMFRTIALKAAELAKKTHRQSLSGKEILTGLKDITFTISGVGNTTKLICNEQPVGQEVRSETAGMMAAKVASIPEVRELLKKNQQMLGASLSLVAEGRDMGTVVFPSAQYKIFLDASVQIRAERRYGQLLEMGESANLADIAHQIRERDYLDRNRPLAPLQPADDAILVDSSNKTLHVVFMEIMHIVQKL